MRFQRKAARLNARRSMARRVPIAAALIGALSLGTTGVAANAQIDATNWGTVTAPVFGTSEAGVYAGADLFAGPNKFGDGKYYHGVLPNGKIVNPAGVSAQIGMDPLGSVLTPDGKYLITSNDDERDGGLPSLQSAVNIGGYSLSVVRTSDMTVVSQINSAGPLYIGLQVKGSGPYTAYASGGPSQSVKTFAITGAGVISAGTAITISPILPKNQGYVSNYTVAAGSQASVPGPAGTVYRPAGYSTGGAKITFPAGSALSPDGRYLYVACNGDNSLAVIDTNSNTVIKQIPVGYFPYGVSVSRDGSKVLVTNWGLTEYKFGNVTYDTRGNLTSINPVTTLGIPNLPDGFYVVPTSTGAGNPKTSSVSIISVPGGNPANATLLGAVYQGQPSGLDSLYNVGDTHPSATAIVRRGVQEVLYVCKANSDAIGLINVSNSRRLADFDLSPISLTLNDGHPVHGSYPNAIVVSPDNTRAYVAEAGLNSVAVLDTTVPTAPKLLGRIPTAWYPTGLSLSADGSTLYVINAKGVGEDINPATVNAGHNPTGIESFSDGNYIFGSAQKIVLSSLTLDNTTVLGNNFAVQNNVDTSIVPAGGTASTKIKHVFFILGENKTFDCFLGNQPHFGPFASTTFNNADGTVQANAQFTGIVPNIQLLARTFATGVDYFSDSEESDAGHQFCMSGTVSDYTEKTILVKGGRGMLVNKNFEAEDYPEGGYIFNNAARNGVSFKMYGTEAARIIGSDTGDSSPTILNDPASGVPGGPNLTSNAPPVVTSPLTSMGDVNTPFNRPTGAARPYGVGQTFFMKYPGLAVMGTNNPNGEPRLDTSYPGYNFNISDQRRALEFYKDFDRMLASGTLPQFLYIYVPNMHTGTVRGNPNLTGPQLVADGDVAVGMIVQHIMNSSVYYDQASDTGSALFLTVDDAQSTLDHIHEHRTPLVVISPFAKVNQNGVLNNGYIAKHHYNTASIVKTEDLLLGLPPNNLGDMFATDLRDMFQSTYNGITPGMFTGSNSFDRISKYTPTEEGKRIWALAKNLDLSGPDKDSHRLGALNRLSMKADDLHKAAAKKHHLLAKNYKATQSSLYQTALAIVKAPKSRDDDD
jgi:YVTN family beta-propeller protein